VCLNTARLKTQRCRCLYLSADSRAWRHRQQSRDHKGAWSQARDRKLCRRRLAGERRRHSRNTGRRLQNGDPVHAQHFS